MLKEFNITPTMYQNTYPYPHLFMDNILDDNFAHTIQKEILNIPTSDFDKYNNPFEQKYTLKNKDNLPPHLQSLYDYLTSNEFINKLSILVGTQLINDPTKNFWGIHKYDNTGHLDVHVDAGIHPQTKLKKHVTLGIYLNSNWKPEYGCELEVWTGDNSVENDAKIYECVNKIAPVFNRMIIFTCTDNSWHGIKMNHTYPEDAQRIFVTLSYLSDDADKYKNQRPKAFFVARPGDLIDDEKDKLRLLRADPEKYKDVYRCNE